MRIEAGRYVVRLAESDADVAGALRLRHRVFRTEMGAKPSTGAEGVETDRFDVHCEHLILEDRQAPDGPQVVGTYRLLSGAAAMAGPGFYSSGEFDLAPFTAAPERCLEVGRTCVDRAHRGGTGTTLMWSGIASLVFQRETRFLFGCASFPGTDTAAIAHALSYLHCRHLAPEEIRARAIGEHAVPLDVLDCGAVDRPKAIRIMPSLIKGYLRLGGFTGDGAFVDHDFGVIDVFLVVDVDRVTESQRSFYRSQIDDALARVSS